MNTYLQQYKLSPEIGDFLSDHDLVQLLLTCRSVHHLKEGISARRLKKADTILNYFNTYSHSGQFSTCMLSNYDSNYKNYITGFLLLLPELFTKLEKDPSIKWLTMSWLKPIDGFANSREFTDQFNMREILRQLLILIKNNRTLYGCGLGLFKHLIDQTEIETILQQHPTLECISLWLIDKQLKDTYGDTLYKRNGQIVRVRE